MCDRRFGPMSPSLRSNQHAHGLQSLIWVGVRRLGWDAKGQPYVPISALGRRSEPPASSQSACPPGNRPSVRPPASTPEPRPTAPRPRSGS
jgi:hypothetical protein